MLILNIVAMIFLSFNSVDGTDEEIRLVRKLLNQDHLKQVRPAINNTMATSVTLGLTLSQLVFLDAKNQILTTNNWIRQVWYNPSYTWNISEYGGVETINLDPGSVWKPDITLYNNAEGDISFGGSMDKLSTRIMIHHTGMNVWLAPAMVQSKCNIDIKYFPFDTQQCNLKFGSWTYDGGRLDLQAEDTKADLTKYTTNSEWHLVSMIAKRNVVKYVCCPKHFPDITYTLVIKRRSLFYLINLIIPLVLISCLSCMTFLVPFESGERVTLSITILLSMTVFMLLVENIIPPTSDTVPLVSKYYTAVLIEMTIGVCIACYNLHLYFIDPRFYKMPFWMKYIVIGKLSRLLGVNVEATALIDDGSFKGIEAESTTTMNILEQLMDFKGHTSFNCSIESDSISDNNEGGGEEEVEDNLMYPMMTQPKPTSARKRLLVPLASDHSSKVTRPSLAQRDEHLRQVTNKHDIKLNNTNKIAGQRQATDGSSDFDILLRQLTAQYNVKIEEEKIKQTKMEWRHAAMVFDQLWFYVFILMISVTTVWVFAQAPGYVH